MLLLDVHGPELIGERLLQSLGTARSMGLRITLLLACSRHWVRMESKRRGWLVMSQLSKAPGTLIHMITGRRLEVCDHINGTVLSSFQMRRW